MHRVLNFEGPKGARRCELCRTALLGAGDGKGERTRDTIRKEARLLDAFDSITTPDPAATNPDMRVLIPSQTSTAVGVVFGQPTTIAIGQEDHELLARYVDAAPWLPRVSRDAVDCQDWLAAAERVD